LKVQTDEFKVQTDEFKVQTHEFKVQTHVFKSPESIPESQNHVQLSDAFLNAFALLLLTLGIDINETSDID
jgi:hypothetical protein